MRVRRSRPEVALPRGERLLAWCAAADGTVLAGSREALYLDAASTDSVRLPWEQVETASWDRDDDLLTITEVGEWGRPRPEHAYPITVEAEPERLLGLLRERVTASIVLQRHVPISGRRGVHVIGRRPPTGDHEITWLYEFDPRIDPADPVVLANAREALRAAQAGVVLL